MQLPIEIRAGLKRCQGFAIITQEIVTVRKSVLGAPRSSLGSERDNIIRALDLLFTGF